MAIKTDELQTIIAPQAADTLLLANSAGGTAQLSLAQAAAFFDAELLKSETALSAALSSKAAKSAQETVESTSVKTEEITLEAAELPGFIESIPRLLNTHYTIHVSGTLNKNLNIAGFYGTGGLRIVADTLGNCVFQKLVWINKCRLDVQLWNMRFEQIEAMDRNDSLLTAMNSDYVRVADSEFIGLGQDYRGVTSDDGACLLLEECSIHGFGQALFVSRCAKAYINGSEDDFHSNTTGVYVWHGGAAFLDAPDLLGGSANLKQGGIIVKRDGTLL